MFVFKPIGDGVEKGRAAMGESAPGFFAPFFEYGKMIARTSDEVACFF